MGDLTSEQLDQLPPKIGAAFKVALTEVLDERAERERRARVPWWVEQLEAVGSLADEVAKLTPEKVAADTWTSPSGRKWYCRLAFTGISPPKEVPTIGFGEICLVLNPSPPRPPAPTEDDLADRLEDCAFRQGRATYAETATLLRTAARRIRETE